MDHAQIIALRAALQAEAARRAATLEACGSSRRVADLRGRRRERRLSARRGI